MACRRAIVALVALCAALALTGPGRPAHTRVSALDPTFGTGGKVLTDFGGVDGIEDVAVQSDGKIVAVGIESQTSSASQFLARYDTDGALDSGFGAGGKMTTEFTAAYAVAVQGDGKIVAGGSSAQITNGFITAGDSALARYLGRPPCKVPNVRGRKLAVARSVISKAHCLLGKVSRKASKTVKRGRVISQTPRAGRTLPNRSKVSLVVSRGRG